MEIETPTLVDFILLQSEACTYVSYNTSTHLHMLVRGGPQPEDEVWLGMICIVHRASSTKKFGMFQS